MTDLIILGIGVHGAEMAELVARRNAVQPTWRLLGHLSPKPTAVGTALNGNPVLGPLAALSDFPHARLVADNEFPRAALAPLRDRLISLVIMLTQFKLMMPTH